MKHLNYGSSPKWQHGKTLNSPLHGTYQITCIYKAIHPEEELRDNWTASAQQKIKKMAKKRRDGVRATKGDPSHQQCELEWREIISNDRLGKDSSVLRQRNKNHGLKKQLVDKRENTRTLHHMEKVLWVLLRAERLESDTVYSSPLPYKWKPPQWDPQAHTSPRCTAAH